MHNADVSALLSIYPLSLNRYFTARAWCARKARAGVILALMGFLAPAVSADTVLRASDDLSAFNDFLGRDTVSSREPESIGGRPKVRYELRQGTKLENGCRFRQISSPESGVSRVEHVIAQDMRRCERLFLIVAPAE